MKARLRDFTFRWHINTKIKKMMAESPSTKQWAQTVAEVQEKVRNNINGMVLNEV